MKKFFTVSKTYASRRRVSDFVKIVEVGPRDGLQNEKTNVPTEIKLNLIDKCVESGLSFIEATAFVSPKWVPQMSDQNEIMSSVTQKYKSKSNLTFSALTPNIQGYNNAVRNGCQEVAVFGAASEAFSQKNINCSIEESLQRFKPVIEAAKQDGIAVRGYVSCVAGCPYQGEVDVNDVVKVSSLLYEAGCYELSLGDTIGVGTPKRIKEILAALAANSIPTSAIALHCHDTYGQAIANCYAGLENDIRIFDSAVAGLGGCPYAKGASGNVSSEDLVYHLHGNGLQTGVDLEKLMQAGNFISQFLNRTSGSKVALASARKC